MYVHYTQTQPNTAKPIVESMGKSEKKWYIFNVITHMHKCNKHIQHQLNTKYQPNITISSNHNFI